MVYILNNTNYISPVYFVKINKTILSDIVSILLKDFECNLSSYIK